ncbi:hypothetical protein WR25_03933 [Diploscapter pachys]|uniref:Membrane protein BRI3 n=1 Tax=Diploscapter pachys TaxID=2018661 RepID=A0A2A2J1P4_9BILA|nr:hypothetical protein WR25_03933 [Diploscapter pachys]
MSEKGGPPPMFPSEGGESSSAQTHSAPTPNAAPSHVADPPYPVLDQQQPQPALVYNEPPPSYQNAMAFPAYTQPATNPTFPPKPNQPPIYYQPPTITQTVLPQPPSHPNILPNTSVVVTVQHGIPCRSCNAGMVMRETDICCVICLVLLAIFTFPFGLLFLCCLPCTVQNRCSNCGHIA